MGGGSLRRRGVGRGRRGEEGGEFDGSEKKGGGGRGQEKWEGRMSRNGGAGRRGSKRSCWTAAAILIPALSGTFGSRLGRDRWRTPGLSGVPAAHGPLPSPRRARRTNQSAHCGRLRPQVRRGPGDSF